MPLGNSNPNGGHIFPTPHHYIYFDEQGQTTLSQHNVKSPGDITITSIETMHYTHKDTNAISADYSINFRSQHCSSVTGYYKHIKGLETNLNTLLTTASKSCNSYDAGDQNVERCNYTLSHAVSSGNIIGTVGGAGQEQANFDFGVSDSRNRLAFLDQNYYWNEFYYMVCPWNYYSDEFKTTHDINNKFGIKEKDFDFVPRQGEPLCGVFMQDLSGTAKGNWLMPSQTSFEKEDYHIALIDSNYDSSKSTFSIGSDSTVVLNNKAYRSEFTPNTDTASFIGQSFDLVVPGSIYCYSSSDDTPYQISSDSQNSTQEETKNLRILLYMQSATSLNILFDYTNTSCTSIPSIETFNTLSSVQFIRDV